MANVENVVVTKFRADISDLQSGLSQVQSQLGRMEGAAAGVNRTSAAMTALGTAAGIAGAMLINKVITPLMQLPALGVQLAAQYEQTQIAFTTMLGSAEKANSFLDELKAFAARTPFELTGLLESAKMMQAFGFEAEEVVPTLTAVGDASAALGLGTPGVQRITLALGQMKAMGRVLTQDLKQLQFAGVPAVQMLADSFGKTVPEMQKMISAGEVASEVAIPMLVKAMQEGTANTKGFGGMMEAQSQTFSGVMSTFKDEAQFALIDGVLPALKGATAALKEMTPIIQPLVGAIGNLIGQGFKMLSSAVLAVVRPVISLMEFMDGLRNGTQQLSEPVARLMGTFQALGNMLRVNLMGVLNAVRDAFDEFIRPAIDRFMAMIRRNMPLIQDLANAFTFVANIITRYVLPAFVKISGFFFGKLIDAISIIVEGAIRLGAAFVETVLDIANGFISAYNFILPAVNGILRATGNADKQLSEIAQVTMPSFSAAFGDATKSTYDAARANDAASARYRAMGEAAGAFTKTVTETGGGVEDTGKKSKKAAEELKKMQAAFNKLAEDANSARDSLLGMTRSVYGELSDLEEALQPENLNIKGVIRLTDELMQLGEKIVAPLKAMGGGVGNLAKQVQRQFNQTVIAARDNFANLLKERAAIEKQLADNESAYRSRVADINRTFDALDKEAAARVKSLESYYDNLIKGLRVQLDNASRAFQEADSKLKELVANRQQALDGIAKGFRNFLNALNFKRAAEVAARGVKDTGKVIETTVKDLGNGIRVTIQRELEPAMQELSQMGTDVPITATEIRAQLQERLNAIREFATNIRTLVSKGLDPALVQEFVDAGVSGAGDVVASLAGASESEIAAINGIQAQLAAQVSEFTQFASQQWYDSSIAQQEAVVAPLRASYEEAQNAVNNAELLRQVELAAAQEQVNILREQRQAAIAQADADYEAQRVGLEEKRNAVDIAIRDQAAMLQEAMKNFGTQTVQQMEWAGNESRKAFKQGFNKKFPDMKARLNQMMSELADSMRRETTITVTTVHRTVYESASLPGRAMGGPVLANNAYVVGERGPEIFVPSMSGEIIPRAPQFAPMPVGVMGGASAGGNTYQIHVNVPMNANRAEVGREIVDAIQAYERRNGRVYEPA